MVTSEASDPRRKRWLPDQAENRLHAQKGLLAWLAGEWLGVVTSGNDLGPASEVPPEMVAFSIRL